MLQRSKWSGLLVAACVSASGILALAPRVFAQADTAPASAPATAPAVNLTTLADDFMYYSLVNNVELAKSNGQAILAAAAPAEVVLKAFEDAANGRVPRDVLAQDLHREPAKDEAAPALKDIARQLLDKIDEGYRVVARDPVRVRDEVDRLANGPRAYQNARERLIAAGQFAAPIFFEYLQDESKKNLHPYIKQVMAEIGRPLVNPLIEELRIADPILRIELVKVLGEIRYPQALPALRLLESDPDTKGELKDAIDRAIAMIDHTGQAATMSPSDLTLRAAENYYNRMSSYQPLHPDEKTNPIWLFDKNLNNVQAINVPTPIWSSVMALRLAEATLRADPNNDEAISLWLAASLRRDIQLPAGAVDPTRNADMQYIALASGPKYLDRVLTRAIDGHDAALALKAIDSLESTGSTGLVQGGESAPLVRALAYADRSVRFRAAFALAAANPTSQFPSYFPRRADPLRKPSIPPAHPPRWSSLRTKMKRTA